MSNAGTIESSGISGIDGINLRDGGSVANTGTAALISSGDYGIGVANAAGTVSNAGTIEGANVGVSLGEGGSVANTGTAARISGGVDGVTVIAAAGTVSNAGTIEGTNSYGVYLTNGNALLLFSR